jgi:hypothetical protein
VLVLGSWEGGRGGGEEGEEAREVMLRW